MKRIFPVILIIFFTELLQGQKPVGSWADHLSYVSFKSVAVSPDFVYASTGSALMIYDRNSGELSKLTKVQGLSETGISSIAWSQEQNSLIVGYNSTNIDIIKDKNVSNIPDIKLKYIPGDKQIYRIRTRGGYAYIATSFGIVVINIQKAEVFDTWKPGNENGTPGVLDVAFTGSRIYAATKAGVYYASVSDPGLSYFGNWTLESSLPVPEGIYNTIISSGDAVYVNHYTPNSNSDSVFAIRNTASLFFTRSGSLVGSIDPCNGGFTISLKNSALIYGSDGTLQKTIDSYLPGTPDISQALSDGVNIWIADNSSGLVMGKNMNLFSKLTLPGPYTDNVAYITSSGGNTYISGGVLDNAWNNLWRYLQVFTNEGNSWHSELKYDIQDPMRILPDPTDNSHFWVSTWGFGLLEFKDDSIANKYDDSNSPLKTIIPGKPFSRICGLTYDSKGNIWMTQTGMPGSIKVLLADRASWVTKPVTIDVPSIGDILIARNGYKWVVLPRGYGLFVLDDKNSAENTTNLRYKQFLVKDDDNHVISNIYCITEDLDGNIWVGTDQGPAAYFNPERIFDDDPRAFRAKIPRNDGTGLADYMLGTEIINSIAVDGGNRKWLGSYSSGAYLISADGSSKLLNYNEDNSPMFSNNVAGVTVDSKTGEVWFGTANGVLSVRGAATTGSESFRNVYSFPNPVRESFNGNVTITGLMRNTRIRITDVSGDLVYRTVSNGGEATWDLTTFNGRRVSTGVYLIFCASEDGSQSCVTKMLVIH